MRKYLLLLFALLLALTGCSSNEPEILFDEATEGLVSVILQDTNDGTIHYDTIGPVDGETRLRQPAQPFESAPLRIYRTPDGCIDAGNGILCAELLDENGSPVEVDKTYARIFEIVSETENDVLSVSIYQLKDHVFVVEEWNVNFWSPYVLYYYDPGKDDLILLYKYDSTQVIGLKPLNI